MRIALLCVLSASLVMAGDLDHAFSSFQSNSKKIVPSDFTTASLKYEIDTNAKTVKGLATIEFETAETGYPAFDLVPTPQNVVVDGMASDAKEIAVDGVTKFRALGKNLEAGRHTMSLQWNLSSAVFSNGAVRLGFFVGDLSDRNFFEKYGPTSFEYDHYEASIEIALKNARAKHVVYTNGRLRENGDNAWQIQFPKHFTASSFYLHIANQGYFPEKRFEVRSKEKTIPVIIYGQSLSTAESTARKVLTELENTYGPYGHENLVVYVTSTGGGMEYCGATMTTTGALGHEITHSWFARGVTPAGGNSAWIDEAIASWRDNGYPRYTSKPGRQNLAGFSPYRRYTTELAYSGGMRVIGHLDSYLGGMKKLLALLWQEKQHQTITTEEFREFLERKSGKDLKAVFDSSVYNKGRAMMDSPEKNWHPRKYTTEELVRFQ